MATSKSTNLDGLLGKTVTLDYQWGDSIVEHSGVVIAVLSVLDDSVVSPAIMLRQGSTVSEYFHLDEITIQAVM